VPKVVRLPKTAAALRKDSLILLLTSNYPNWNASCSFISDMAPNCARWRLRPFSRNPPPVEKGIYVLNAIALPTPNLGAGRGPQSCITPTIQHPASLKCHPPAPIGTYRHLSAAIGTKIKLQNFPTSAYRDIFLPSIFLPIPRGRPTNPDKRRTKSDFVGVGRTKKIKKAKPKRMTYL